MALETDPVGYIFGGTSGVPTYEELKRRRAIAVALASRQRGFPKTVGEGLTYLGESIGDVLADRRLTAQERQAGLAGAANLAALRGASGYEPGTAPASPAAPRSPSAPVRPQPSQSYGGQAGGQAAPAAPPASAAEPVPPITATPVLPSGPSSEGMTSGPPPSEFAMGGILNAAPMAAPNLEPAFPGEGGVPSQAAGILPSSGYLPPAATAQPSPAGYGGQAAAPPSTPPAPQATAPPAPGPQSSMPPPDSGDTPPNVLAQAQQVALQGGPAAVSRFMADAGYPKSGAWCGQFAAAVASSAGVQPPAGPAVASNWRNVGTPVDTPQVGDVAIARPGWAPRRGSGETGDVGSHVTFVNQADPAGTFQGLGGNQGSMVKPFNARDFEFRRLPGDVQGHRIVGIPGEEPLDARGAIQQALGNSGNVRLASYAPDGGAGAPIPGMGGAGSPRLQPQIPPLQGPPPAPESEQITPTDIMPMPATAQFGPPVGRFTRTDAPVPGVAAASPPQAPAVAPPPPQGPQPSPSGYGGQAPPATYVGSTPSREPIPPAQPQTMEPPGAPPVRNYPGGRPLSARQQRAMQIMQNPMSDPASASAAEQIFKVEEEFRKRAETQDESDYAAARSQHFQKTHEFEKFQREEADRLLKQQAARTDLEKTRADLEEKYYQQGLPRVQAAEKARLEIDQAKRTLAKPDTYAVGGTHVERPYTPGGPQQPYTVPAGLPPIEEKPLTETQAKGQEFVLRVRPDIDRIDTQFDKGKIMTNGTQATLDMTPGVGNYLVSDEYRTVRDGLQNWGAGFLTHVSGAAVSPSEAGRNLPAFIPRPGDSDKQVEEKAARRRDFTNAIEKATTPGQLKAIEKEKNRLNDEYSFDRQAQAPPVSVKTPAEADALPPGQKIILPDGRTGQVPRRRVP